MYSKGLISKICEEYFNCTITRKELCDKYNIKVDTLKSWLRRYYPVRYKNDPNARKYSAPAINSKCMPLIDKSDYKDMTKEEMQMELIKKDFEIERLKKNYQVKIDPTTGEKVFVSFKGKNMK